MLLFVFLVATTNLAIGYALGSGMQMPTALGAIPFLRRKKGLEDLDSEDLLTRPATPAASVAETAPPTPVGEELSVASDPSQSTKPSPEAMMAGLANLQEKLLSVGDSLKENVENPEEFDQCASRLQEANHDYLDQATGAIEQLSECDDTEAEALCQVVSTSRDEVEQLSGQVDSLLETPLDDTARRKLIERSNEVSQSVGKACDPVSRKPHHAENTASSEALFERLEEALAEIEEGTKIMVAEAQLDPLGDQAIEKGHVESVSTELAGLIDACLDASQICSIDGQRLLLLEGDNYEQASQRIERLRQQVEATTFQSGESSFQATITCAVSEVPAGATIDEARDQLSQALNEADKLGSNRTFHHDGAFATVIDTIDAQVEPRTVSV